MPPNTSRPQPEQPAADFPTVGMTLSSYTHDPFTHLKSQGGRGRIPQPGRIRRIMNRVTLKRTIITLAILILIPAAWLGWKFIYNAHKLFGGSIFSIFTTSKLKGEDTGRVNILLAGDSADDPGHEGANLTDSIMLLSINTKDHTAFMLSIPRDLYVHLPGDGYQKINAANVYGNSEHFHQSGYPAGGMGLLEKTVEQDLGVDINYYALINYSAFRDAVNAVGGIDVTINSPDGRLYDPNRDWTTGGPLVNLKNGKHHLNGEQALDLARARGDPSRYGYSIGYEQSDFTRTANQRMMLVALKNKAASAGVVTNPIRLGELFDAIGKNVKTDFALSDVHRLYDLTKDIGTNSIKSVSLNDANGKNLLASYQAPDGQSALIPAAGLDDFSDIKSYVQRLTSNNPVVKEGADVVVLNATNSIGLAGKQEKVLENRYVSVSLIADAPTNRATTLIIDNSGGKKPATKQLLQNLYGNDITSSNPYPKYSADFIVILGTDQLTSR